MTNNRNLDLLYERYTDQLIEKNFGSQESNTEEEDWDEAAEDRALDKWRGID